MKILTTILFSLFCVAITPHLFAQYNSSYTVIEEGLSEADAQKWREKQARLAEDRMKAEQKAAEARQKSEEKQARLAEERMKAEQKEAEARQKAEQKLLEKERKASERKESNEVEEVNQQGTPHLANTVGGGALSSYSADLSLGYSVNSEEFYYLGRFGFKQENGLGWFLQYGYSDTEFSDDDGVSVFNADYSYHSFSAGTSYDILLNDRVSIELAASAGVALLDIEVSEVEPGETSRGTASETNFYADLSARVNYHFNDNLAAHVGARVIYIGDSDITDFTDLADMASYPDFGVEVGLSYKF